MSNINVTKILRLTVYSKHQFKGNMKGSYAKDSLKRDRDNAKKIFYGRCVLYSARSFLSMDLNGLFCSSLSGEDISRINVIVIQGATPWRSLLFQLPI